VGTSRCVTPLLAAAAFEVVLGVCEGVGSVMAIFKAARRPQQQSG